MRNEAATRPTPIEMCSPNDSIERICIVRIDFNRYFACNLKLQSTATIKTNIAFALFVRAPNRVCVCVFSASSDK